MGLRQLELNTVLARRIRLWGPTVLVVTVAGLLALGGDGLTALLRFERAPVGNGELWRLLSGHFVHLGMTHFVLNAAGLVLVMVLVGTAFGPLGWLGITVFCIAGIDAGLWLLDSDLVWYVGLSGLLHGLLAAGLVARARIAPLESLVIAGLVAAKILFEQLSGPLPGSESTSGGAVVVNAHLYGAISGILAGLAAMIRGKDGARQL